MKDGRGFLPFRWRDLFRRKEPVHGDGRPDDQKFTGHDILAIIIAVFSIVLPWVLAIVAVLGLILFLITKFYLN